MDDIIEPTMDYDFSKIYLGPPSTLAGGAYFTKILNNNKALYLQTPKSLTKQGFVKSGKKLFADLMFDNNDTIFINWIENLETKCQELIHNKGAAWFQTSLEKDDIETAFTSPFKIYKSGKYYLLRVNVKPNIKIYNEADESIKIEDINVEKNIISILEIQGIKFTSRNFQIEIELKQAMVVSPDPFLDECFIKKPVKKQNTSIPMSTPMPMLMPIPMTINLDDNNDDNDNDDNDNDDDDDNDNNTSNKNNNIKENILNVNDLDDFIKDTANELSNAIAINTDKKDLEINANTKMNDNNTSVEETNKTNSNENVFLEIEDLNFEKTKDDSNILTEVDLSSSLVNSLESFTLKKPNQVYYEIYKKARDKAKECKKIAMEAYLEAKNIKNTYMLDNIDDDDDDDNDSDFDYENENENNNY
jgi:hypothetical protein